MDHNSKTVRGRQPAVPLQQAIDPAGWTRQELEANDDWLFELTDAHVAELDAAVEAVERRNQDIMDVGRDG